MNKTFIASQPNLPSFIPASVVREDRFRPFHELLSLDQLNTCVELAKGAAFGACKLERQVNADEIGFAELMKWLRYGRMVL